METVVINATMKNNNITKPTLIECFECNSLWTPCNNPIELNSLKQNRVKCSGSCYLYMNFKSEDASLGKRPSIQTDFNDSLYSDIQKQNMELYKNENYGIIITENVEGKSLKDILDNKTWIMIILDWIAKYSVDWNTATNRATVFQNSPKRPCIFSRRFRYF
jgi:hypothetical protein